MSLALLFLYLMLNVLRMLISHPEDLAIICWVISWVVLLWFDVCWCYVVVWLWWCGIRMQAAALGLLNHTSIYEKLILTGLFILTSKKYEVTITKHNSCFCSVMCNKLLLHWFINRSTTKNTAGNYRKQTNTVLSSEVWPYFLDWKST